METTDKQLDEKESLALIAQMINKAKEAYSDTGVSAIMWGSVITICSLLMCAQIQYNFKLPFDIYLLTIIAVIPQLWISFRDKKTRKVKTYDDQVMSYIWIAFGVGIFLLIHINRGVFIELNEMKQGIRAVTGTTPAFQFNEYIMSYFLILYGLPTFITGGLFKFKPMIIGGILCWTCSIISVYTEIRVDLLLTALSASFAWLIPGIIMRRQYKKAKTDLLQIDV
jgi:hypothetical protein